MRLRWRVNLKRKLFGFVGMASLLILAVLELGVFTYSNIEIANFMKEDVHRIIEKALDIRVAEKTYLQFQTSESKTNFDNQVKGK